MINKEKIVLIGNGMAGVRSIEELLKLDAHRFHITIFGEEPYPNYNRIQLSKVLQGDTDIADITLNDWEWYAEHNIDIFAGEKVIRIDAETKTVHTDKGQTVAYDKLIIATGSVPFIIPVPGHEKKGVTAFRDIKDCEKMISASKEYKRAAVIGGGLLGLEAARGLLNLGMEVDVIHLADFLMERQMDETAGRMLQKELEKQGMNFLMQKQTAEILGEDRVSGIRFNDGEEIQVDLVVMAVGIRPNTALAKENGIAVNRGIVVSDFMETSVPDVYAVGECAEHREIVYGLVAPLYEQGKAMAAHICGQQAPGYEGSVLSTQLKVSGVDVFSVGEIVEDENTKAIKLFDDWKGTYKKVVIRDGKMAGAVLFGDTSEGSKLLRLINKKADVEEYLGAAEEAGGESLVASMEDSELICGCNGVSKGDIVCAIKDNGLTTVDGVKGCTSASRSCGGCKPLVADLLALTLGDEFDTSNQKEAICGCTTLSRDEVVEAIRAKGLKHTKEVMNVLGWENDGGCSKCRPALNYYLGMVYPVEHEDEKASKFVNERMHGNIQKDGTYSVVPRMYGGVTSAEDLRKIADVADKYSVPLIKVTGGQRIDLFGVKKEDLPGMWADLDMPSGYAYGKTLRTVKTCVGESFCRFGTQDSMGMGVRLEKKFERIGTPHKFKMAVSACPRNCAESGIKDFGVVGVDGGWEMYVGGNGGTHLRAAELLGKVKTDDEVMEWAGAFMQYYREDATYLERTSVWVERVGLDHVKQVLSSKETRDALNARIDEALSVTSEPWKEVIENEKTRKELYETELVSTQQ